jgi:hypothetical protein
MKGLNTLGQVVVSVAVIAMMAVDGVLVLTHALSSPADDVAKVLIGGLLTLTTSVVNWWLGSSRTALLHSEALREASQALAFSSPPGAAPPPGDDPGVAGGGT